MAEPNASESARSSRSRGKTRSTESFFSPFGAQARQYEDFVPIIEAKAGSGRRAKLPDLRVRKRQVHEDTTAIDLSTEPPQLQDADEAATPCEPDECEPAADVSAKKKIDKDIPDAPWRMCAPFHLHLIIFDSCVHAECVCVTSPVVVCNSRMQTRALVLRLTETVCRYIALVFVDTEAGEKVQAMSRSVRKGHVSRLVSCEACSWYYDGSSQYSHMQEAVQNMKRHCGFSGYDAAGDPLFTAASGEGHRKTLVK
jgi:hypothetical protein